MTKVQLPKEVKKKVATISKFSDHFGIKAGHRILKGGAGNNEVYNFALFNYTTMGLSITL